MELFVGTYTDVGGPGIWFGELWEDSLRCRFTVKDADNPNYLLLHKDRAALFAVCGNHEGGYFVLSYNLSEGGARLISKQAVSGVDPCHLALSENGNFLVTANYGDGSISVFPVEGTEVLPECQFVRHVGKSVHPTRQEAPHAHHVSFSPSERGVLCVVDLGIDKVVTYRFDETNGSLTCDRTVDLPLGSGPRHLVYGKGGQRMYVCDELSSEVSFIEDFKVQKTLSTLPTDFSGESSCAAIRLSEDGNALFVSNRGHDSIAVFSIGLDGVPIPNRHLPCGGNFPRDFQALPDGRLLIANQNEGGLVLMDANGRVQSRADIPGAVAIVC